MSKLSPSQRKTEQLGDALVAQEKAALMPERELTSEEIAALPQQLFERAEYSDLSAEKTGYSNYSYWRSTFRMFLKNRMAVVMLVIILLLLAFTFIQPYLPGQMDPTYINNDPETGMQIMNRQPCKEFWFGTNNIGQDLWARLWAGTRTSLLIGFAVALIRGVVGVVTGLLPTTGISLPFFSYGGTALSIQLAEMGIVLSVSRQMKPTKAG